MRLQSLNFICITIWKVSIKHICNMIYNDCLWLKDSSSLFGLLPANRTVPPPPGGSQAHRLILFWSDRLRLAHLTHLFRILKTKDFKLANLFTVHSVSVCRCYLTVALMCPVKTPLCISKCKQLEHLCSFATPERFKWTSMITLEWCKLITNDTDNSRYVTHIACPRNDEVSGFLTCFYGGPRIKICLGPQNVLGQPRYILFNMMVILQSLTILFTWTEIVQCNV